jgi:hypothetical protein
MRVTGFVDHTHPAFPKFLEDAVMRDGSPNHWCECYVCKVGESIQREKFDDGASHNAISLTIPRSRARDQDFKLGCCDAPPTYTYFSIRDGTKLRSTHDVLNNKELEALDASVIN